MNDETSKSQKKDRSTGRWSVGASRAAGELAVHVTGVLFVAVTLAWMTIGSAHLRWMVEVNQQWGDASLFASELAIHLLVSLVAWTMLYLSGKAIWSGKAEPRRVIKKARGTVMTETIIILPLILTLIMGLSQVAVMNLASMLFNYASSQAGRTVWLWHPETYPANDEAARRGVTEEMVIDMARIQAAASLTPVAPSDFRPDESQIDSDNFFKMRASLLASQLAVPPNDSGRIALDGAQDLNNFDGATEYKFYRALDTASYPERSVRKFTFAYLALDVELVDTGEQVGVTIHYSHKVTFPLVGHLFGSPGTVAGLPGVYINMTRDIMYFSQVPPNAQLPEQ